MTDIMAPARRAPKDCPEPVHVLVVGTSTYPYADEENPFDESRIEFSVKKLSAAARTASWFAGWLVDDWSRKDQIESLHLLLSPAEDEVLDARVSQMWTKAGAPRSTLANFESAFFDIRTAAKNPDAVVVVYLAGHGSQVDYRQVTVLLEDYLKYPEKTVYHAAIDSAGCHKSLNGNAFAQKQFWFVDACRTPANIAGYKQLHAGYWYQDEPHGEAKSSPIFFSTSDGDLAYATPESKPGESAPTTQRRSLFSQGLDVLLAGEGATRPVPPATNWSVRVGSLLDRLPAKVSELASEAGLEQNVRTGGVRETAIVHEFDTPPFAAIGLEELGVTPKPDRTVTVAVDADVGSWELKRHTHFKIHQGNGPALAEGTGLERLQVGVHKGLKAVDVSMLNPDGVWQTKNVDLPPDNELEVAFTFDPAKTTRETGKPSSLSPFELAGVSVITTSDRLWTFEPVGKQTRVPRASFEIDNERVTVSLPVNPTNEFPLNACHIHYDGQTHISASFTPERRVSHALESLIVTNQLAIGIETFEDASALLLDKYSDPVGAVLGGLTLHRLGRLRDRQHWIANLASDFGHWLPDAGALQAAVLRDGSKDERDKGLKQLLKASRHRPMYTDGLALIADLLRRWPDEDSEEERTTHLEYAANFLAKADQSSVFLITRHGPIPENAPRPETL